MEAAGLGIGIVGLVGLFSSCLEITERWDFYKDSVAESASLKARLTADRIRFQQWGKSVGINSNGRYEHNHHKALDNPSIRSAIGLILQSIKDIDEDVDRLAPHLGHVSDSASLLPDENSHRLQSPKLPALSTRRSRIGWALRGRGRATMLVVSFETLVQKLHDLIPFEITPEGSRGGGAESSNAISSIEEANTSWHVDAQNILADLEKHIHNEVRKDLIDWLDAPDTQGTYHDRLERRLEGTCDWILDRPEFRHWQSPAQNTKILWINGPPGYGKTILAARIVEHLSVNPETSLAYFFWSETEYCVDPFAIMRAWVSQLIQTQEGFNLARERWEAANERTASKFDIKELFGTIVQYIPRCALVVDGLDECDTVNGNRAHRSSVSEFLNSLTGIALKSRARLLIVSRNELAIREGLRANSSEMKEQLVELQIVPNDVEADATLFSQSVVNKKLGNKTEAERKKLANELVNRCDSMFLGMKLLENDLRGGKNLKQLRKIIDEAPNKLDRIYDRNWERIQSFDESSRLRAFSILRWAAFSRRPLTVLEITEGLLLAYDKCEELDGEELDYEELPDSIDSIYIKTEILDLCVSLVEIRPGSTSDLSNSTVHLTHFSVREYILRHMPAYPTKLTANEQLRSSNNAIQNNIIAKACLRYLNCGRIWGETQPKENASPAIGAFRAYAAGSWQQHVEVNVDNTRDVMQLVNAFFRPANQNWQSWRKDIDSISRYMPIKYDGAIDTGNPLFYAALLGFGDTVDYLIDEMGLDVNHVDSSNRTALLAASSYGSLRATMHLLEKGANANIASNVGLTPLHASALRGHVEIVKTLLQNGADPMLAIKEDGYTPLHLASLRGHVQIVELLLKQDLDLTVQTRTGHTPLHIASSRGHVKVVKLLLKQGLDPTGQAHTGHTPLHIASSRGHVQIAKVLLEKGAKLNITTYKLGRTPLHLASLHNRIEITKLLVENGADLEIADGLGYKALHIASKGNHIEIVKLLLENKANIDLACAKGFTALHFASKNGHIEIVKLLLKNGATTDLTTSDGATALHTASHKGHIKIVQLLLENGGNIDFLDKLKRTTLYLASSEGHIGTVKLLLENGASVDLETEYNWTPLLLASSHGNIDLVRYLLQAGADPNSRDHLSRTPLFYATMSGSLETWDILFSEGHVSINSTDHYGSTVLSIATRHGHIDLVARLLSFEEIEINTKDNLGRTPLSWSTTPGIRKLFAESAAKRGVLLHSAEDFTHLCSPQDMELGYCDVCTSFFEKKTTYYSCKVCYGGVFVICQDCYTIGASCLGDSHEMVYKVAGTESDADDTESSDDNC